MNINCKLYGSQFIVNPNNNHIFYCPNKICRSLFHKGIFTFSSQFVSVFGSITGYSFSRIINNDFIIIDSFYLDKITIVSFAKNISIKNDKYHYEKRNVASVFNYFTPIDINNFNELSDNYLNKIIKLLPFS